LRAAGGLPVLVETALALLANVLGPDGFECAEAARRLNVADEADADERGRLEDGDGLDDLLFVDLGAGPVDLADDVGHAGLVGEEGGEVDRLGGVGVLGEGLDFAAVATRPFLGQEALGAVARRFKLAMRLKKRKN
jgi:hypothetical protein